VAAIGRFPPGRTGRLWLRRRLMTAELGADQLTRKLRVLITEQERLQIQRLGRQREWTSAWTVATTWQLRAGIVGGQEALARAASQAPADVELTWATAVGLRYPADVRLAHPAGPAISPPGNTAIPAAQRAFETALLAAARLAAADEAVRRVEAEVALTRRRVRALEKQWLPSLRAALTAVEQSLEQAEQDDGARLRRAAAAEAIRRIEGRSRR
jgi:V/A-type H+/Na+-transporting ATPase subunit D